MMRGAGARSSVSLSSLPEIRSGASARMRSAIAGSRLRTFAAPGTPAASLAAIASANPHAAIARALPFTRRQARKEATGARGVAPVAFTVNLRQMALLVTRLQVHQREMDQRDADHRQRRDDRH